ncbi:MAG: diguanylate cyclase [Thermoleophilia bacterium]
MEALKKEDRNYRILVAEDSPTQRQIIMSVLRREGYEVVMASDGIEAVTQAFYMNPDLILLDIEMPKMNGYQVCRLLKDDGRTSHIPVVMLTSRNQETDKYWGLKTGADSYVTKDFKLTGLADEVQNLLDRQAQPNGDASKSDLPAADLSDQGDMDVLSRVNDLLDRKLYEATIINEISRLNTLSEDSGVTISSVLTVIAKVTDCHVCSVLLLDEKELIMHVQHPIGSEYYEESLLRAIGAGNKYVNTKLIPGQIRVICDADPLFLQGEPEGCDEIRSELIIPLKARTDIIALLMLNSPKPGLFTEEVKRVLNIVEHPASVVVDNARLHEGTKRLAVTDGLTRLFNHRHFYELLEQEFHRTKRYETQLAMIMVDIDFFKQINDTYGHQAGDDILKDLAQVIAREVREVDLLARYGGEEFAVLLPQTNVEQAAAVAERIRAGVENHHFIITEGKIRMTVSLGVAGFPESDVDSHAKLVQQADAALYRAKAAGKNRVELSGANGATEKI